MPFETNNRAVVHVVDDDPSLRGALQSLFESVGLETRTYGAARDFLDASLADGVCTENLKSDYSGDEVVCRGKAQFLRGCKSLPARVAPAGSNRSRRGGNDSSEASDGKGH